MTKDQIIENYIRFIIPHFTYKSFIDRDAYYYGTMEVIKVYRYGLALTANFHEELQKFLPFWEGESSNLNKIVSELAVNSRVSRTWYSNDIFIEIM